MVPAETYELSGFLGHVVFTKGHIVRGDELTIYDGALPPWFDLLS